MRKDPRRLAGLQPAPGRYGPLRPGQCASLRDAGLRPGPQPPHPSGQTIEIAPDGQALRLTLFGSPTAVEGVAEFSREALRDLTFIPAPAPTSTSTWPAAG